MPNPTPAGAALSHLREKYRGNFREIESFPIIGVAAAQVVANSADRLGLLIMDLGASTLFVSTLQTVNANAGIQVAPNGGGMALNVDEDFTLVTRQLFGISPGGNTQLYVLELVREVLFDSGSGV
jgi:hypothetical protein